MYKFFAILSTIILLGSCSCFKHIPREEVHIVIKDSTVVNIKDSTVFHHKTVNRDYAGLLDTLRIKGAHSSMTAFADTANFTINGQLNEDPYKERVVYRDRIQYRDSIQYVKEPYPVEVVKEKKVHYWYEKYLWIISILALTYFGWKIYRLVKPVI